MNWQPDSQSNEFFSPESEVQIKEVAFALFKELQSIGVNLFDMDVEHPCQDCARRVYRVRLGALELDEVHDFVDVLRALKEEAGRGRGHDVES